MTTVDQKNFADLGLGCDVCQSEPAIGLAAIPMMPMSVAYCLECLRANAHPWWALIANTVAIGGLEHANDAWVHMVECTCLRLGRTREDFEREVFAEMAAEDEGATP